MVLYHSVVIADKWEGCYKYNKSCVTREREAITIVRAVESVKVSIWLEDPRLDHESLDSLHVLHKRICDAVRGRLPNEGVGVNSIPGTGVVEMFFAALPNQSLDVDKLAETAEPVVEAFLTAHS